MRKLLFGALIVGIAVWVGMSLGGKKGTHTSTSPTQRVQNTTPQSSHSYKELIFLPYWQDMASAEVDLYDRIVYFGITTTKEGIDRKDPGYAGLDAFAQLMGAQESYLTLRMTNPDVNASILEQKNKWLTIMDETVDVATSYKFDGIVLDLEQVSIFNHDAVQAQITDFIKQFVDRAHEADVSFAITLYGDVYYRRRPYDVVAISQAVDEIMVMGYDLHKRNGQPGPNFPLFGREQFGYDIRSLMQDIGQAKSKMTMLFGMYGYDWIVDEQKRPIKGATAMTLAQIEKQYVDECAKLNCVLRRDPKAGENEINFVDAEAQYHIIWYEDEESVEKKQEYLKSQGVSSFGFWAYGYF